MKKKYGILEGELSTKGKINGKGVAIFNQNNKRVATFCKEGGVLMRGKETQKIVTGSEWVLRNDAGELIENIIFQSNTTPDSSALVSVIEEYKESLGLSNCDFKLVAIADF